MKLPAINLVEPLMSGQYEHRVITGMPPAVQVHEFILPVGGPMSPGQGLQYGPSPEISIWAGIRPSAIVLPQNTLGSVWVECQLGLLPTDGGTVNGIARSAREERGYTHFPSFTVAPSYNILAFVNRVGWPVGGLSMRIGVREDQMPFVSVLGAHFTFFVAWAVCSFPAYLGQPIDRAVAAPSPRRRKR